MLTIHFLNVGHGDCTIIKFPSGRIAMVDINNSRVLDQETARELAEIYGHSEKAILSFGLRGLKIPEILTYEERFLTDPVEFYLSHYGREPVFRFILTHPDMDHMTGLYRLHRAEQIRILNFWDTIHSVEKSDDPKDWENTPYDIRDWRTYQRLRKSDSAPKPLFYVRGHQNHYYMEDGIRIWAPFVNQPEITEDKQVNLLSYVLLIEYGECRVLLGGDALEETWEQIYEARRRTMPKINLLKAPHHGRKSGYYWPAVKAMAPDYTVVSVGKLRRREDASASYERHSVRGCYSTRFEGDITAYCWDNGHVELYSQRGDALKLSTS